MGDAYLCWGRNMKIAICGSLAFEPKMQHINQELSTRGYDTVMPHGKEGANTDPEIRRELIDDYFAEIDNPTRCW